MSRPSSERTLAEQDHALAATNNMAKTSSTPPKSDAVADGDPAVDLPTKDHRREATNASSSDRDTGGDDEKHVTVQSVCPEDIEANRPKDIYDRFSPARKNWIVAIVAYSAFIGRECGFSEQAVGKDSSCL